ncbi:hypothetical protein [Luteibacter anthropi]|uniref:Uncharacterized protein n=1 Tax=Luteibacter anthropi TaxID=564369 RepID=A0A7X5UBY1_9GAMM|nr:hypothetical protein [Luteibacter anthropi]NII07676.1 hypothetical protein [Luteibacter anthropi]
MAQRVEIAKAMCGVVLLGINIAVLMGKREDGDPLSKGAKWNVALAFAAFVVGALAVAVFASESCTVIEPVWTWTLDIAGATLFGATMAALWLGWLAPGPR